MGVAPEWPSREYTMLSATSEVWLPHFHRSSSFTAWRDEKVWWTQLSKPADLAISKGKSACSLWWVGLVSQDFAPVMCHENSLDDIISFK